MIINSIAILNDVDITDISARWSPPRSKRRTTGVCKVVDVFDAKVF